MNARRIITAAIVLAVALVSSANPIVWLHGWNSDGELWEDIQAQMVQSVSASTDDFLTLSYYSVGSGFTTDSPIEEVAQAVSREIVNFYEDRKYNVPMDVVAHSMGGLVFRSMIAQQCFVDNSILRRYVTLGTPHYGQNLTYNYQAKQMKYGSNFLWHLGEAWHFDGKRWPSQDTLCVAGISDTNILDDKPLGSYWDGLVHAWSASLGGDVPVRYVYRSHSSTFSMLNIYANAPALCSCENKEKDAVFCLIRDFLDDGSLPESLTPTYGGSYDNQKKMPGWVQKERSMGSLFAQAHSASNCVPLRYTSSDIVDSYKVNGAKPEDLCIEYGADETSGYSEGIFQIFGNLPTGGVHEIVLWKSGKTNPFVPTQPIVPEPGSCRLMRFYDSSDPTLVATAAGQSVSVPLSWLSATGLVANVESLADCSNKLTTATANGYTGAECWYYGVNPLDAGDRAWIWATGLTVANGSVRLGFSGQNVTGDRVHVQRTASLAEAFADVADGELVREEGSVSIPASQSDASGFYRLFVR